MANEFAIWESRLVQHQMAKLSDEAIALLLDRSVEEVNEHISYLTGGQPSGYQVKQARKLRKKQQKLNAIATEKLNTRAEKALKRQQKHPAKKPEKKFETKIFDSTGFIAVRVDHKTLIYVKPGTDIEKAKQVYRDRVAPKPENPNTPVKNFK